MRLRVLHGLLAAVVGVGLFVPALVGPTPVAFAQDRPTREQPPPGEPIGTRTEEPRPWSYNHVARYFAVSIAFLVVALLIGYLARWVGLGRRTT